MPEANILNNQSDIGHFFISDENDIYIENRSNIDSILYMKAFPRMIMWIRFFIPSPPPWKEH